MSKKSITTISATEMQAKSGDIIRRVFEGEHFIVERYDYPILAILPVEEYRERFVDVSEEEPEV